MTWSWGLRNSEHIRTACFGQILSWDTILKTLRGHLPQSYMCPRQLPCLVSSAQNQEVLFDFRLVSIDLWPNTSDTKLHKHNSYRFFSSHGVILLLQLCLLQAGHLLPSCFLTIRLNRMLIFLTGTVSTEIIQNSSGHFEEF